MATEVRVLNDEFGVLNGALGEQFPAMVDEVEVGFWGEGFAGGVPVEGLYADAPSLMVAGELEPLRWQGGGEAGAGLNGG